MKKAFSFLLFSALLFNVSGQGKFKDPRDGHIYSTTTFNKTTWMVENLKFMPQKGAYYFDNDSNNISGYGILYDWKTANTVCPVGWRLPSGPEFQTLVNRFDRDGWERKKPDTTSFGIQLGGMQNYEGTFTEMDESGYYWTSTEYDKDNAEYFSYTLVIRTPVVDVSRKDDISDIHGAEKINRYSVRCVKK